MRGQMARVLGIDDSQVHVIMPDVGGAFGLKMHPHPEELATVVVSKLLGRPVKWIQDRRENLIADEQAREDQATVTMAAAADGSLLGAKVEFLESRGCVPERRWERGGLHHGAVPRSVSLSDVRGLGADGAHEHVGPRRVPRAVDDRNSRARADDRLSGRAPRDRPVGAAPAQRHPRRRASVRDADRHGLRPDDRVRDARAGRREDRLRRAARATATVACRRSARRHRDESDGRADRDRPRLDEHRRGHGTHRPERKGRRCAHRRESWTESRDHDRPGRRRRARRGLRAGSGVAGRHRHHAVRARGPAAAGAQ